MNCKFIQISENHYRCQICGFELKAEISGPLYKECTPEEPGLIKKAISFVTDVTTWISAGAPITDDTIVKDRLKICESCEHYNQGSCKRCGCNLGLKVLLNTSSCPIGKW